MEVRPGEVTPVAARAKPAIAIRTTVRDARTRQPVANTCVRAVDVNSPGISRFTQEPEPCSDGHGVATIGPLPERSYRLLARPEDGVHGLQWVGWRGGTGDQEEARRIDGRPGTIITVPDITLDGAGTISGTVRDEHTGQPLNQVYVFPYATDHAFSDFSTDLNGNYRVTGLGPYRWPLEFAEVVRQQGQHAWRWSGNAPDRLSADRIKVTAGGDTRADELLPESGSVTGLATVEGSEFEFVSVVAFNARSGDYAGPADTAFPDYTLANLATSRVKIRFIHQVSGAQAWYLDAPSFGRATPVRVRAGQTTSGIDQVLR